MKENTVYLYGQVSTTQIIKEEGHYIKGMVIIKTISKSTSFSTPLILSKNQEIIERISWLQKGDMIRIKGVVNVENVYKTQICPKCGKKNKVKGVRFCVIPIALYCEERALSEEEGLKRLQQEGKFANQVLIAGTVCNKDGAIFYRNESGAIQTSSYQIASNRKFLIKEDRMDIKTDYPWIYTNGAQAASDATNLKQGSEIFVKGSVIGREIERKTSCQHCNTSYVWWDQAGEIAADTVYYLNDNETDLNTLRLDQAAVLGKIDQIQILNDTYANISLLVMPHVNFFKHRYSAEIYTVMLLARKKEEVNTIKKLKNGDYILAYGVISGATSKKKFTCTCGKENINSKTISFVYPNFIKKIRDPLHESLNISLLSEYKEFSNNISFVGIVSSKPLFSSEKQTCVYYVTFKHSLKTEKGEIDKKENIRICSTGKQAREDMLRLLPGTKVFINGFLRSYDEEKTYRCECNNSYYWNQSVTEIVPYSVEYLSGYLDDKMIKSIL